MYILFHCDEKYTGTCNIEFGVSNNTSSDYRIVIESLQDDKFIGNYIFPKGETYNIKRPLDEDKKILLSYHRKTEYKEEQEHVDKCEFASTSGPSAAAIGPSAADFDPSAPFEESNRHNPIILEELSTFALMSSASRRRPTFPGSNFSYSRYMYRRRRRRRRIRRRRRRRRRRTSAGYPS